jgi:hypothetical protein
MAFGTSHVRYKVQSRVERSRRESNTIPLDNEEHDNSRGRAIAISSLRICM